MSFRTIIRVSLFGPPGVTARCFSAEKAGTKSSVLRKLGTSENNRLSSKGAKLFTKSIRVVTKMDLYSNIKIVNQSIRQWMMIHPFLRANVAVMDNEEKCFVVNERLLKDPKSLQPDNDLDLENVEYLMLKAPGAGHENRRGLLDDTSQLLIEKELNAKRHFDIYKQLLWHMKFFTIERSGKLNDPASSMMFEYEIILVIHHIVSDRRNSHMILLQLLNIIERNMCISMGKMNKNMARNNYLAFNFMPSIEELFSDSYLHELKKPGQLVEIERPPAFVSAADRKDGFMPYKNLTEQVLGSLMYQVDSRGKVGEYAKMDELLAISKESNLKFRRFILNELTTNRLIQKCLDEKSRLTGTLNTLMCYSLSKLFKKLDYVSRPVDHNKAPSEEGRPLTASGENEDRSSVIKYLTPISLRGHETRDAKLKTIDSYMMGYCVSTVAHQIQMDEFKDNASSFKLHEFWSKARNDTTHLHASIRQGDFFQADKSKKPAEGGLAWHFQLANMGVSPSKTSNRNAGFLTRITHVFSEGVLGSERVPETMLFACLATIEDRLCITFQHDSRLIDQQAVDELVKNFFFFLREVCRDRDMDPSYDSPFYFKS